MPAPLRLILASASPRRLDLVRQMGFEPDLIDAAALDETPHADETPRRLAMRLAGSKADLVADRHPGAFVLAADTVVAVGRRILPKADDDGEIRACLGLLSGRGHRVLTAIAVRAPDGRRSLRLVETRVRFKRLASQDVDHYILSREGLGKAGGYAIQGRAGAFVTSLQGSYTGVVGLPLYETSCLLTGLGYAAP